MRHFRCEVTDTHTFEQPLDMRNFPFDTQALEIKFEAPEVRVGGRAFGARILPPLHEPHVVDAEADLLPANSIRLMYGVANGYPAAPGDDPGDRFPGRTGAVLVFVERNAIGVFNNVILPTALFQVRLHRPRWL